MANNFKPTSQYYDTPIKDFYLDIWVEREVPITDSDELYIISAKYDKRPDLLSYDIYGTEELWWVFSVRNKDILIDPIEDFVAGTEIYIPKNILQG